MSRKLSYKFYSLHFCFGEKYRPWEHREQNVDAYSSLSVHLVTYFISLSVIKNVLILDLFL